MSRQPGFASHMVGADRRLVHAGNNPRTTWRANAGSRKGACVAHAFRRQLIEMRCDSVLVAETTQVRTDILTGQP